MTRAEFTALIRHHRDNLVQPPTVVAMGFSDYEQLREEMLASEAALVACRDGEPWHETGKHLARLNLQHFFLNGVLVLRVRSHPTGITVL